MLGADVSSAMSAEREQFLYLAAERIERATHAMRTRRPRSQQE
jgi:hypothetical protein